MPDSERPSIGETKRQMQERHQRELKDSGYDSRIRQLGATAGAIVAIFSLGAVVSTQVWPWMVRSALRGTLEAVRDNTKATNRLGAALEKQTALLEATIKAAGEHVQEGAIQDEKLRGSIEALRNEVRLRHGVLDVGTVMSSLGQEVGSGSGGGGRAISSSTVSSQPRKLSRLAAIQAVVQQADERLKQAKKPVPKKKTAFRDSVKAQLK